jgi:hypothetical protein
MKLFGKSSDALAVKLISAPARKKMLSELMPRGRFRESDIFLGDDSKAALNL